MGIGRLHGTSDGHQAVNDNQHRLIDRLDSQPRGTAQGRRGRSPAPLNSDQPYATYQHLPESRSKTGSRLLMSVVLLRSNIETAIVTPDTNGSGGGDVSAQRRTRNAICYHDAGVSRDREHRLR
jgi:hypothetical protein